MIKQIPIDLYLSDRPQIDEIAEAKSRAKLAEKKRLEDEENQQRLQEQQQAEENERLRRIKEEAGTFLGHFNKTIQKMTCFTKMLIY